MKSRTWLRRFAILTLLSLGVLIGRPVALQVLQVRPDPQQIKVVGAEGTSQHCIVVSDCDAVTTSNTAVDLAHVELTPNLIGITVVTSTAVLPVVQTWSGVYLAPPPKSIAI